MEREKFEESWKHAFDEAEISPSEKVWTNIELELEKANGGELKRRLLFYQLLAAASVVFAMAIGGAGYYFAYERPGTDGIAINTPDESSDDQSTNIDQVPAPAEAEQPQTYSDHQRSQSSQPSTETIDRQAITRDNTRDLAVNSKSSDNTTSVDRRDSERSEGGGSGESGKIGIDKTEQPLLANNDAGTTDSRGSEFGLPTEVGESDLSPLFARRDVKLNFEKKEPEVDPVLAMLAKLDLREREMRGEKDSKKDNNARHEKLWTSVGFAAGSFNAVQAPSASPSTASYQAMAIAAPIVDQESKASGYSYSMGVNLGTKISERWVLQGGVNYLTQSSEYTATGLVADGPGFMAAERYKPLTSNAVVNANEFELGNKIVYSAPYNVNNSMRYLSIPLQAGYLLVDKTIGVQLNAGVATDLFLQNTVSGEGDQVADATMPRGSDSPYRSVNLSGLFGTEVSYRVGPHYRVSLNPGIRYPFNTIYKSELGVQSSPLTFDVGLRFRYIFH